MSIKTQKNIQNVNNQVFYRSICQISLFQIQFFGIFYVLNGILFVYL